MCRGFFCNVGLSWEYIAVEHKLSFTVWKLFLYNTNIQEIKLCIIFQNCCGTLQTFKYHHWKGYLSNLICFAFAVLISLKWFSDSKNNFSINLCTEKRHKHKYILIDITVYDLDGNDWTLQMLLLLSAE